MSQVTKRALEASLKKLLLERPLDKITVTDIAEDCGINRMTFYYHFRDIYDLVEWACQEDARRILDGKRTYTTWQEGFRRILDGLIDNRPFISTSTAPSAGSRWRPFSFRSPTACSWAWWRSWTPGERCGRRTRPFWPTSTSTPLWGWFWTGSAPA